MPRNDPVPTELKDLLAQRTAAREALDWARADELRDTIAALGWEVQDGPRGSKLRPLLPGEAVATGYARPQDLASLLEEAATVAASIQVVAEDHPEDLRRLLDRLAAHPPAVSWELILVANAPTFDLESVATVPLSTEVTLVPTSARLGWADSRNLGLRRSRGEVTVVLDSSIEPTGDFLAPLLAAFDDPSVGIAGGWGVTSVDGRHFVDAPPGEVDAIEGYCLAVRRDALRAVGGFEPRFRFYRNADLDFSFAVRDAGWRALRTDPLPVTRHEHRGWEALPDAERDRLSKRNFYRFLQHWGDRPDLLLERPDR